MKKNKEKKNIAKKLIKEAIQGFYMKGDLDIPINPYYASTFSAT